MHIILEMTRSLAHDDVEQVEMAFSLRKKSNTKTRNQAAIPVTEE